MQKISAKKLSTTVCLKHLYKYCHCLCVRRVKFVERAVKNNNLPTLAAMKLESLIFLKCKCVYNVYLIQSTPNSSSKKSSFPATDDKAYIDILSVRA